MDVGAVKLDTSSLERIDSFPYRHKVAEVMSAPVVSVPLKSTLIEAARLMAEKGISSILVADEDNKAQGIVTERDVLRAVAQTGSIGMHQSLNAVMSAPVATVREDALVFVALGRMDRLKIRHLVVVDRQGRPVGMVSARSLLKLRAGAALALGDEIASAPDAKALAQAHDKVPSLAQALLEEGVEATGIANVISTVLRDITARAAEISERAMAEDGWGGPPVPGCLLILGSGGRGEALFSADQDNAIIYEGGPEADPWYAEISRRICETLDQAGVPKCKRDVMCVNAQWRQSSDGWKAEIDRWMSKAKGEEIASCDIFVDFKAVYGTQKLADPIRQYLQEKAAASASFLRLLAASATEMRPSFGLFGNIRTAEGRFDIKRSGFLLLVGAVRVLALKNGIEALSTRERLAALAKGGHLQQSDMTALSRLHDFMIGLQIRQQLSDLKNGLVPSDRVDPKIMSRAERSYLKEGLKRLSALALAMQNTLAAV
jgi:CBS domain-containing protein